MTNRIDYFRLATWSGEAYTTIAAHLRRAADVGDWFSWSWLQYRGFHNKATKTSYGHGEQQRRPHYIIQATGNEAHDVLLGLFAKGSYVSEGHLNQCYLTRIDIQQTIFRPPEIDMFALYDKASLPRKRKQYIRSDSETVYFGSRTANYYARCYEKLDRQFLRLEIELKGEIARRAWTTLCMARGQNPKPLLGYLFRKAAYKLHIPGNLLAHYIMDESEIDLAEAVDLGDRMKRRQTYLANTELALANMLQDHDLRSDVLMMLDNLSRFSARLDTQPTED